jgi:hypothetical protein
MDTAQAVAAAESARQNGLAAMLMQWATRWKDVSDRIKPLLDQPVIRQPYTMPNALALVVPAGVTGMVFPNTDFSNSLEWPFEVHEIKPTQDPSHTFADWRLSIKDQTFDRPLHKANQLVAGLVDDNTGVWKLAFPWVMRNKGGGFKIGVDNLEAINPISVNITLRGYLLIPRA